MHACMRRNLTSITNEESEAFRVGVSRERIMSTSKHFDRIAAFLTVFALVLTILFMHGEALGIERIPAEEASSVFTENDLDADWSTLGATEIVLTGDGAEITGAGAYFLDGSLTIYASGRYVIRGELSDGSIIINETSKTKGKIWILLGGVSVSCSGSAALDIEEAEKVFLTLAEGTENTLSCGSSFSEEAVTANIRGALFSRDDLTINGNGSLTVTSGYRHGIVCNDDLRITGGSISVTAPEDAIHANNSARLAGMTLTLTSGDQGITVQDDTGSGELLVESGSISILSCTEGLESEQVTVNGGTLSISFTDDAINATGPSPLLTINGGSLFLVSENARDVDGLDSNGDIIKNGGTILISVPGSGMNNAIDYGSETGGKCLVNGGTLIAAGGAGMQEGMSAESLQCSIQYGFSELQAAGTSVSLTAEDGTVLLEETIPLEFQCLILSTPALETGASCTLTAGDSSYEIELTETAGTYGASVTGGFGGGFGGRGMGGRNGGFEGRGGFRPEMENGELPESAQSPAEITGDGASSYSLDGAGRQMAESPMHEGMRGRGMQDPGMPAGEAQVSAANAADLKTAFLITGFSLAVLLGGILLAGLLPNKKNIAG